MAKPEPKMVIVVRKDLEMRKGKIAAQVAHASMKFLVDNDQAKRADELHVELSKPEAEWLNGGHAKVVVYANSEDQLRDLMFRAELQGVDCYPVVDAGRTEFHGVPTLTCAAFGPDYPDVLDSLTGDLKLL